MNTIIFSFKMKRITLLIFFITSIFYGQSSSEIAEIYLIKSEEQLKKKELSKALVYFDKAKTLLGDDTTAKVEEIGTMIYFQLEEYTVAKEHAKNYFALSSDKGTERYNEVLYLYVEIEEKIEEENRIKAEVLAAELLSKKKQLRLDSLTNEWHSKADVLSVVADTIYEFDKNGIAVFKNSDGFFGIINDNGTELVNPSEYSQYEHYDGKIVLMEGVVGEATKIITFDTAKQAIINLPSVSSFNQLSTNYGKVMLPRESGLLVTFPNNSKRVLVFDMHEERMKPNVNLQKYFEYWKTQKVIKKFNKENQIKIDKEYLDFGGDLGGYFAFYYENGSLFGYISLGGTVLKSDQYKYIGTLSSGGVQAVKNDGSVVWLNEKGKTIKAPVNKNGGYNGSIILRKVNSKYQFINEKNEIIKGDEVLMSLDQYLKVH